MKSSDERDLVTIEIEGKSFEIPGGESLLVAIQHIVREETPVMGRFCWSDECGNCELLVSSGDDSELLRACQTEVTDGMRLSQLKPDLRYWLHRKLR